MAVIDYRYLGRREKGPVYSCLKSPEDQMPVEFFPTVLTIRDHPGMPVFMRCAGILLGRLFVRALEKLQLRRQFDLRRL